MRNLISFCISTFMFMTRQDWCEFLTTQQKNKKKLIFEILLKNFWYFIMISNLNKNMLVYQKKTLIQNTVCCFSFESFWSLFDRDFKNLVAVNWNEEKMFWKIWWACWLEVELNEKKNTHFSTKNKEERLIKILKNEVLVNRKKLMLFLFWAQMLVLKKKLKKKVKKIKIFL